MTREKAEQILKELWRYEHTDKYTNEEIREALDIGLNALRTLDKIRDEIDKQEKWLLHAGYTAYNVDIAFDAINSVVAESEE